VKLVQAAWHMRKTDQQKMLRDWGKKGAKTESGSISASVFCSLAFSPIALPEDTRDSTHHPFSDRELLKSQVLRPLEDEVGEIWHGKEGKQRTRRVRRSPLFSFGKEDRLTEDSSEPVVLESSEMGVNLDTKVRRVSQGRLVHELRARREKRKKDGQEISTRRSKRSAEGESSDSLERRRGPSCSSREKKGRTRSADEET